jgi:hypothetical protein
MNADNLQVEAYGPGQAFLQNRKCGNKARGKRTQCRTQNSANEHESNQIEDIISFKRHIALLGTVSK